MNEIGARIAASTAQAARRHLEAHQRAHLTADVSSYARGRTRVWLEYEGPLSARRGYARALHDAKLWDWLCECWGRAGYPGRPDLGLALHGAIGIAPHRDASYAHARAITVNLGPVEWGWHPERNGQDNDGLVWTTLDGGEILRFDCKHKHASRNLSPERWAIVLWSAKRPIPVHLARTGRA